MYDHQIWQADISRGDASLASLKDDISDFTTSKSCKFENLFELLFSKEQQGIRSTNLNKKAPIMFKLLENVSRG